ncbi:hypothetical protein BGX23_012417 [Mortierella sp. AD031]|nr:hypothetical protein BGX23_012417 [Mortierella sp. AD031]
MEEHPDAGVGGATPTTLAATAVPAEVTRIPPGTTVQRRSTDNTLPVDYIHDERKGRSGDKDDGGSIISGPGVGLATSSSYSGDSQSRSDTTRTFKEEVKTGSGVGRGVGRGVGDVESQISSEGPEDNSPIEEVRAIVPVSFVNQFFYLRQNPVSITYTVVSLISLPLGRFLARVLPTAQFRIFGGLRVSLDPGPFNIKEHALIGTAVACCSGRAYAVDIMILQRKYYNDDQEGFMAGFMLVLTTQVIGFSLAGVLRKCLAKPGHMIWPANLVTVALFRTLHESSEDGGGDDDEEEHDEKNEEDERGHAVGSGQEQGVLRFGKRRARVGRMRFFGWVTFGSFFWEDGSAYDKGMVMTDNVLDPQKYEAYGPLRMDSFFGLTYGIGFAGLTATLTHVVLYHGKDIRDQWRAAISMKDHDIHSRMMVKYKEVPQWLFLVSLEMSIITVTKWHYLPWYHLLISLAIAFIFALPVGIVQAVTNQQPGLNVITEYVIGYLMPGHPIANVTFKAYGYITNVQALQFTQDLKLGHYMKLPPGGFECDCGDCESGDDGLVIEAFYSASMIWGVIGPGRMFGLGTQYSIIQWGFVIGALLPLPVWWLCRRYPRVGFL